MGLKADLARLRKISLLTGELGMNLAGATRVLELEDIVARLDAQVEQLKDQLAASAVHAAAELARVHRSYRRDLVRYQPPKPPSIWTSRNSP